MFYNFARSESCISASMRQQLLRCEISSHDHAYLLEGNAVFLNSEDCVIQHTVKSARLIPAVRFEFLLV